MKKRKKVTGGEFTIGAIMKGQLSAMQQKAERYKKALEESAQTHHGLSNEAPHMYYATFKTCPAYECERAASVLIKSHVGVEVISSKR